MTRRIMWIMVFMCAATTGSTVRAQAVVAPVSSPVDHPLVAAHPVRTSGVWRKGVEQFGESLAGGSLRFRGYDVINMKLPGNRGIDLVAVKRSPVGVLTDVRLVEVKSHHGNGKPRLGQTRVGTQMSRDWLAHRLRALRASGEQGRKLASEIARFRRSQGIPIERLGELHDVNLRAGRYTIRNPISMAERAEPISIPRLLNRIARHSDQPASRAWSMRHLSQFDQLRRARMATWVGATSRSRALGRVSSTRLALLQEQQMLRGAGRGLAVAAGRIAIVVAVVFDAYEIYSHMRDYRLGKLSQRAFAIAMARSGGGIAGAWGGAWGGASAGAWVGTFGGPFAWVTVPLGGVIGGAIGGVAGYIGGFYAGEYTAQAWYGALDRDVQYKVAVWLKQTPAPFGN